MAINMSEALRLVRSGRLHEATEVIQKGMLGAVADTAAPGQPPMKDVTPRARALPSSAKAGPEAKPLAQTRDKPQTKAHPATGRLHRKSGLVPYRLYVPANPDPTAPLIVMLHGCTQSPEDFAAGTRMNEAAERIGAHVIWPEQQRSANPNGCWNWFEPGHQGRGGEAAAISAIAAEVARIHTPDAAGIHVAGLSAGGAMAAILGTHYPEVFASVAVHSGLPVGSASDMPSAFAAMRAGGVATTALPLPVIVFHGSADRTVAPANANAIAKAGPGTGTKPRRRVAEAGGRRVTVTRAATEAGKPLTELWEINGLGHAWSGGHASGSYADPLGPDATAEMLRFFQEVGRG